MQNQDPGELVRKLGRRKGEESAGTGEELLSAICLLFHPFARVGKFQRVFWQKKKKCLSRVRGLFEARERAGTGRDRLGGLFCQLGIKGMKQMSPGLTRQAGESGESLEVQDQGQVAGKI